MPSRWGLDVHVRAPSFILCNCAAQTAILCKAGRYLSNAHGRACVARRSLGVLEASAVGDNSQGVAASPQFVDASLSRHEFLPHHTKLWLIRADIVGVGGLRGFELVVGGAARSAANWIW